MKNSYLNSYLSMNIENSLRLTKMAIFAVVICICVLSDGFSAHVSAQSEPTPVITYAIAIADTYIASGNLEQRRGAVAVLWVGHKEDNLLERRSLLKFVVDASTMPQHSQVQSAILRLKVAATTSNVPDLNVTATLVTKDFSEEINWIEHESLAPFGGESLAAAVEADLAASAELDVTDLVQKWDDDGRNVPLGFLLKGDQTSGVNRRGFWSRECTPADCTEADKPILTITYIEPEPSIDLLIESSTNEPVDFYESLVVTLTAKSGPTDLTSASLTSTIPSRFRIDFDSISHDGALDTSNSKIVQWTIPTLLANQEIIRNYEIRRSIISTNTLALTTDLVWTDTLTSTNKTKINFEIEDPPNGENEKYCYQWDFGDGAIVGLENQSSLDHIYEITAEDVVTTITTTTTTTTTYYVKVIVTGPDDYRAIAGRLITIERTPEGYDEEIPYEGDDFVPCTIHNGDRAKDIVIRTGVTGFRNGAEFSDSAEILIAPSVQHYMPLIDK